MAKINEKACSEITDADLQAAMGCGEERTVQPVAVNVINVVIGIVGIVAVVAIVVAGQRMLTSMGDPGQLKQAKSMILYAIIGLVVAIIAWAVVNFLISNL